MASIGVTIPQKRNSTLAESEVHRKSSSELQASAFNADQLAVLLPMLAAVDESTLVEALQQTVQNLTIPVLPTGPAKGESDAVYLLKIASSGTQSWQAYTAPTIPSVPSAPAAGASDATYLLKVASGGTLSWEAVTEPTSSNTF